MTTARALALLFAVALPAPACGAIVALAEAHGARVDYEGRVVVVRAP